MNIAKTKSVLWNIFVAVFTVAFCSGFRRALSLVACDLTDQPHSYDALQNWSKELLFLIVDT